MILVDSSVWIDFFSRSPGQAGQHLHALISRSQPVILTGVIICEILQGLTRNIESIERYLRTCTVLEPTGFQTYRQAASIFRLARSRGVSLTTIDTLIAAVAIENGVPVFTADKDFPRIARIVPLRLYDPSQILP